MKTDTVEKERIMPGAAVPVVDFESQYIALRKKEQRYYTNEEAALLPDVAVTHPHYTEWKFRKNSCNRLIAYMKKNNRPLAVLEVGCGNGWLSSKMAGTRNNTVTGSDINITELKQGAAVFEHKQNLHFIHGDIRDDIFTGQKFDIIVFAASIQYFPSVKQILEAALNLLEEEGEIHIIDSPLYKNGEEVNAKQRSKTYFESLGFPGMAAFYYHHSLNELKPFNYRVMYDPSSITNKLLRKRDPFNWIRITRSN